MRMRALILGGLLHGLPGRVTVVWCALSGCGHQCDNTGGVNYKNAIWKF